VPKSVAYVLAVLVVLSATGCASITHKVAAARAFAGEMKPGHQYRSFFAPSGSMEPTIHAKTDYLLVDESAYDSAEPQRGDIIVFMPPIPSENPFVKRIIALPGDKLTIRGGAIRVNDRPLPATIPPLHPDYAMNVAGYRLLVDGNSLAPAEANVAPRSEWTAPDRLPRRCYIVLGDNVNNSEDSHIFGCAELRGTFSSGLARGKATQLIGKLVKVVGGNG
jgi:signal peptidase I